MSLLVTIAAALVAGFCFLLGALLVVAAIKAELEEPRHMGMRLYPLWDIVWVFLFGVLSLFAGVGVVVNWV